MAARPRCPAAGARAREDRRDSHAVADPLLLSEGGAVFAVVERSWVRFADNTTTLDRLQVPGSGSGGAPRAARATAFLVAYDLVVTAGSWTAGDGLREHVLVFDFEAPTPGTTRTVFPAADVHTAVEVVARSAGGGTEWAVLRLGGAAAGRLPLSVRRTGRIDTGTPVHVIGHPSGLPRKTVRNLRVVDTSDPRSFVVELEPFGGDCGAPVFSSRSHLVEGVLVSGRGGASPGRRERVTRIGELVHAIPTGAHPTGPGAGDASATAR